MSSKTILNFCKVKKTNTVWSRNYAKAPDKLKVTVCGAAGNVGRYVSLMLKQCPLIDQLTLFDVEGVNGYGLELSHIDSRSKVDAYSGADKFKNALEGSKLVVITAAARGTSHFPLKKMFNANANVVHQIAHNCVIFCPKAIFVVATNPVNSMVPMISEIFKQNGNRNSKIVLGATGMNLIRANTVLAQFHDIAPESVCVPVIGGHCPRTMVPLLSLSKPSSDFSSSEIEKLTLEIRTVVDRVVKAKVRKSDNLSCAYATSKLAISVVKALKGYGNIMDNAYVRSEAYGGAKYFSSPLILGKTGVKSILPLPSLTAYEKCQIRNAVPIITADVERGEKFAGGDYFPECDPCKKPKVCPPKWCDNKDYQL